MQRQHYGIAISAHIEKGRKWRHSQLPVPQKQCKECATLEQCGTFGEVDVIVVFLKLVLLIGHLGASKLYSNYAERVAVKAATAQEKFGNENKQQYQASPSQQAYLLIEPALSHP